MIVMTTAEAAQHVGVSPVTVRHWVLRGYLTPVRPGAKPLLFREQEVLDCHAERMPQAWRDRVDRLAEQWDVASEAGICNDRCWQSRP